MNDLAALEKPQLGEQELETLRFVSEHAPISVGDVAKSFGLPRGLARTTILTVMERLRTKGYLARKLSNGVYQYSPKQTQEALLTDVVAQFVERSLGGSLSPFVAYLADSGRLTSDQLSELHRMIEAVESDGGGRA